KPSARHPETPDCASKPRAVRCTKQAGIGIAIAWGFVSEADAAAALEAIDGLGARVFGLSRR
ncbi:MAG TPA: hypothetical protein VGJ84_17230, partial [Polyangiaceae bacterium]